MSRSGEEGSNSTHGKAMRDAGPYITLGLELGLTMIAWSLIGYLLDRWLGTLPWLTLAGIFVGMCSLFMQLARAAKKSGESARRGKSDSA